MILLFSFDIFEYTQKTQFDTIRHTMTRLYVYFNHLFCQYSMFFRLFLQI